MAFKLINGRFEYVPDAQISESTAIKSNPAIIGTAIRETNIGTGKKLTSVEVLLERKRKSTPLLSSNNRTETQRKQNEQVFKEQELREAVRRNVDIADRTVGKVTTWTPFGGLYDAYSGALLRDYGYNDEARQRGVSAAIRMPFDFAGGIWSATKPLLFATSTAGALALNEVGKRTNLDELGTFVLSGIGGALGAGVNNLVTKTYLTYKALLPRQLKIFEPTGQSIKVSNASNSLNLFNSRQILDNSIFSFNDLLTSKNYKDKYLELLGNSKEFGKFKGSINDRVMGTRPFVEYMESLGIDSSTFTEADINKLTTMRSKSIQNSIPQTGRSAISYETKPRNQQTIFAIDINDNGSILGEIQARSHNPNHPRANEVPIDMISRMETAPSKGLSEDAYNAAIDYIKQTNIGKGLVSGDRLLSPEITYRVWEHYPNRILLRNRGHHSFGTERDVVGTSAVSETHEGPIVMLTEPSKTPVPMKSNYIFHPDMIKDGKLLPPNWNKYGIYYSLSPLLLYGMSTNKKNN